MGTEADEFNDVVLFVNPDEEEISLNVTFHATFVVAMKYMRFILRWYGHFVFQHLQYVI